MRWIHKTCRKQMRWREKFFWVKIYENELGDNIPHTLCIPQPQPFYNFFGGGKGELRGGDVPSRRVSPCTLLSYEGGSIRVGLKDGGKRKRYIFFFVVNETKQTIVLANARG